MPTLPVLLQNSSARNDDRPIFVTDILKMELGLHKVPKVELHKYHN